MRRPTDSGGWLDTTPFNVTAVRLVCAPRSATPKASARRQRVRIYAWLAVVVTGSFANAASDRGRGWYIALINVFCGYFRDRAYCILRELIGTAYVHRHRLCGVFAIGWDVGTDAGDSSCGSRRVGGTGRHRTHRVSSRLTAGRRRSGDCPGFMVRPLLGFSRPWAMSVSFVPHDRPRLRVAVATV